MRVVTTCHAQGLKDYAFRWLEARKNWPKDTEFLFYREGFEVDCPGKDLSEIPELQAFKRRHAGYKPPDWRFDVVKFSNIAFAIYDALHDHDGIGMRLDADAVTYKKIPKGLIEKLLDGAYLGAYQRQGMYSETGIFIVDCKHPQHKHFMDVYRDWYLSDKFKAFNTGWHDCIAFDYAIKVTGVPVTNLSGEHFKSTHPQALSELGRYIDHCKGPRKEKGASPENKFRKVA